MKSSNTGIFLVLVIASIFGVDYLNKNSLQAVKQVTYTETPLEKEIHKELSGLSKEDKEKFYVIFSGISRYCVNVKRVRDTTTVNTVIKETFFNYKMEDMTQLDGVISKKMKDENLTQDASLLDNWQKLSSIFEELADGVKYSIEKDK